MLIFISAVIDDPNDREFMEQFYLEYERLMYATVLGLLADPEAAKDIVQESVLKLIPKISFLRQQKRCINANYVVSTVRNTTINYLRKQSRIGSRCSSIDDQAEQDLTSSETSPDRLILLMEEKELLVQIWGSLSEEDRLLLEGKYILGYHDDELATMLGCRKDSVRMKLTRARRRAFQRMLKEGGDYP